MTTRELFASAAEILPALDPARTAPEPGSGPDKLRPPPEFAAMIDRKTSLDAEPSPDPDPTEPNNSSVTAAGNAVSVPLSSVIIPFPEAPAFFGSALFESRVATPELDGQAPVAPPASGSSDGSLVALPTADPGSARIIPFASLPGSLEESLAEIEIDVPWPPRQSASVPAMADQANGIDVIVPVDFGPGRAGAPSPAASEGTAGLSAATAATAATELASTSALAPSHLPGAEVERENSAPLPWANAVEGRDALASPAGVAALFPEGLRPADGVTPVVERVSGIAAAPKAPDMDSFLDADPAGNAEQAAATTVGRPQNGLEDLDGISVKVSEPEGGSDSSDFPARTSSATEWQTGRPVGLTDRPTPPLAVLPATDAETQDRAEAVERLSQLVLRETAVARQHGAGSMTVVLRPDADTELFVHFTQRNGQLQAAVRCERGDFQQLNLLWPQLQEALAHQKVSLASLEESATPGDFRYAPGPNFGGAGQDRGEQRNYRDGFASEEAEAPRRATSPEPGLGWAQGERKTAGLTALPSRPGWETWA